MKAFFNPVALLFLTVNLSVALPTTDEFPKLTGQYLGQKPPGMTPELFAPGIVSLGYHEHRMAISPDGKEIYFTIFAAEGRRAIIMFSRMKNGIWTPPAVAPFSDSGMNLHPAFAPDGKRLYFTSTRSAEKSIEHGSDADIWFVERQGDSWSEPVRLSGAVNTGGNESSPSLMADGTLFFDRIEKAGQRETGIYFSRCRNGAYQEAEKLPAAINSGNLDLGPFIFPDGGCLLFYSSRPGSLGEADVYVAFRKNDAVWSDPINLGEKINSKFYDWAASVTPDGKYIIFSSSRNSGPIPSEYAMCREALQKELGQPQAGSGTFYWVDAKIIDQLKTEVERRNAPLVKPGKQSAAMLIEKTIRRNGAAAAQRMFQTIKVDTAHYDFDEEEFDDLGYTLLAGKAIPEAVAVFEMGVELFPESGNSYASLADACLFAGNKQQAKENYRLALTRNPYGARRINYRLANLDAVYQSSRAALKNMAPPGKFNGLHGPYLGQTPPGNEPRLFAPGFVSLIGWSFWCTFSPDGKEFYFSRGNKKKIVMTSRLEKEGWTAPLPASFTSGQFSSEPHIPADNRRIYFAMGEGLMAAERTKRGWLDPRPVGPGMHVTSSQDGQIYVTDMSEASTGSMALAKVTLKDGRFEKLERLQGGIAKAKENLKRLAHPCIAPDGSYILFDNGRGMLHVSFRAASGEWGEAIDLTMHGIDPAAGSATLSPDGRYLFISINEDLYWMSTEFIEDLRRGEAKPK